MKQKLMERKGRTEIEDWDNVQTAHKTDKENSLRQTSKKKNAVKKKTQPFVTGLVWFLCLMAYQPL